MVRASAVTICSNHPRKQVASAASASREAKPLLTFNSKLPGKTSGKPKVETAVPTPPYNFNGMTTWRTSSLSTAVIRHELSALFSDRRAFSPSIEPNASSR